MMKIISIIKLVLTVFLSVLVSLYMFETYQILFNAKNGYEKIIEKYYNETGKEYDERTKYEIYNDLKKVNKDISVSIYPMSHLKKKEIEIFPLSGISNVNSIHCNENGYYSIFQSDRFGFNNPDIEWDSDDIEKFIIRFCKTKKALTYYELEEQIKHNVLYESHCFNDNILGKFFRKDLEN